MATYRGEKTSHKTCSICTVLILKGTPCFSVPKHEFENWKKIIPHLERNGKLCGLHFDDNDISKGVEIQGTFHHAQRIRLRKNAVPKHHLNGPKRKWTALKAIDGNVHAKRKKEKRICTTHTSTKVVTPPAQGQLPQQLEPSALSGPIDIAGVDNKLPQKPVLYTLCYVAPDQSKLSQQTVPSASQSTSLEEPINTDIDGQLPRQLVPSALSISLEEPINITVVNNQLPQQPVPSVSSNFFEGPNDTEVGNLVNNLPTQQPLPSTSLTTTEEPIDSSALHSQLDQQTSEQSTIIPLDHTYSSAIEEAATSNPIERPVHKMRSQSEIQKRKSLPNSSVPFQQFQRLKVKYQRHMLASRKEMDKLKKNIKRKEKKIEVLSKKHEEFNRVLANSFERKISVLPYKQQIFVRAALDRIEVKMRSRNGRTNGFRYGAEVFTQAKELLSKLNSIGAYKIVQKHGILPLPSISAVRRWINSSSTKSSENLQAADDPAPAEEIASQVLTGGPVNCSIDGQVETIVEVDLDLLADIANVLPSAGSTDPASQLPSQ